MGERAADGANRTDRSVEGVFSPAGHVAAMLRVEAAIAAAEADVGLIPAEAAAAIAAACDVDRFDVEAIERGADELGNAAIPLVRTLTELVPQEVRGWVHLGATSQDVLDTAAMLQVRDGIDLLVEDLATLGARCVDLARRHGDAVMAARTLLQHATPTTFGLKVAHWLDATTGGIEALRALRTTLPVQLGGAGGTLAALGEHGPAVIEGLASRLELVGPDLPWHTDRRPVARVAAEVAIAAGGAAKIALDVALLMQTEVGEASEGGPAGPSSAMPQKRNPVRAPAAIAAARLAAAATGVVLAAIPQEHERGLGSWQAEREALREAFRQSARAIRLARAIVEDLEVEPDRMRANLRAAGGSLMAESLVAALVPHVGRAEAYRFVAEIVERAAGDDRPFRDAAADDARLTSLLGADAIEEALEPSGYLGAASAFVDAAIARFERTAAATPTS
jgi:3-carboxy-cis,cis-muconate cycloisomerase